MNEHEYRPDNGENTPASPVPPVPEEPPVPPAPPVPEEPPVPPTPEVPNGWQNNAPAWSTPPTPPSGWQQQPTAPQNTYTWSAPTPTPPTPPKKPRNSSSVWIAVLGVVCAACVLLSAGLFVFTLLDDGDTPSGTSKPNVSTSDKTDDDKKAEAPPIVTTEPKEEGLSSRDIVADNLNSTVIIRMFTNVSTGFFSQTVEETSAGEATGIVWTADGYIITNAHCVYNEKTGALFNRIEVELYDGTVFSKAEVVGYDTTTDLAVILVDSKNLTPAEFGDSDALQLGDRVLALGNNSGLGWTVTGGMVSGLARDVYEETNYAIKCLQVDAVINPGNSGGPLLNSSGQVVGINSAKIVAEGYEGLGFSIPINEAKTILQDLVSYGYVKGRVMLGIEGYTFDTYRGYEGFYISAIGQNSCFAGTRAQVGDIITHINDVRVKSYAEMREQLTSYPVGEKVTVTLMRIQRGNPSVDTITVEITLMESDGSV